MASVARNEMEKSTSKPIQAHSIFMNGYPFAGSYRFGQIQPHFVQEVVPDDDITLSTAYKLDTYTLGQPMMQDMFITHGYYFVPLPALLPRNYEKLITNPVIGEDIDPEQIGLAFDFNNIRKVFLSCKQLISFFLGPDHSSPSDSIAFSLRWVLLYDMIYGLGGLPAYLGYKFITKEAQVAFEAMLTEMNLQIFNHGTISVNVDAQNHPTFDNLHDLLEFIRDDFDFDLSFQPSDDTDVASALLNLINAFAYDGVGSYPLPSFSKRINVGRILSYQITCAHFFSNDKVDYIYSADLWRQNVFSCWQKGSYFKRSLQSLDKLEFTLNGEKYLYDILSSFLFNFVDLIYSSDELIADCQYLRLLFGFNYSLRHVDYFTGSRTRPLAVGDVGVRVNDGVVNVVENIQKTWVAKFFNQVNRTGRRIANYTKGLFPSAAISQDWHEPLWLGDTTDKVGSSENQNTGSDQFKKNAISSNLQSNASKYGFRYHNTQYYGYIIGVVYFDIERFYSEVCERPIFHVDRFDMFNPFLQFNGDQEVYGQELSVSDHNLEQVFGYQSRYLEYKERVPQCAGAFEVDPVLSKSIFIADSDKKDVTGYMNPHISPSYIRSHPLEFDKFYTSLTGLSLANYYHFQIIHWNRVKSVRPMVKNPQLG